MQRPVGDNGDGTFGICELRVPFCNHEFLVNYSVYTYLSNKEFVANTVHSQR